MLLRKLLLLQGSVGSESLQSLAWAVDMKRGQGKNAQRVLCVVTRSLYEMQHLRFTRNEKHSKQEKNSQFKA